MAVAAVWRWRGGIDRRRLRYRSFAIAAAALLALSGAPDSAVAASTEAKPQRIVSMNLCTDQLLMLLADPNNIASVSFIATNPAASAMADQARRFKINHGLAEQILPLKPDLVLAGTFTTRPTVFLLKRLGYRVVEIPVVSALEEVRENVRTVARAVGETERGEKLIAAFDAKLRDGAVAARQGREKPVAALYWANGYSSGHGTLADAVVRAAGFRNLAAELGLLGSAQLSLETLIVARPDVLIVGRQRPGEALASEILRHPALLASFSDREMTSIADRLWVCGTPFVADAVQRLRLLHRDLDAPASAEPR